MGKLVVWEKSSSMYCYAQLVKSPNDHQGADIRCKSKSFYYQARAGAPTDTNAAAIGTSPELWVSLFIQGILTQKI